MIVSSSDLLGTAGVAATQAYASLVKVRDGEPMRPLDDLRYVEAKLAQALAEVRIAAWGISRRNPGFDSGDLDILVEAEERAIRSSAGSALVPQVQS